jgi:hypothetical protein
MESQTEQTDRSINQKIEDILLSKQIYVDSKSISKIIGTITPQKIQANSDHMIITSLTPNSVCGCPFFRRNLEYFQKIIESSDNDKINKTYRDIYIGKGKHNITHTKKTYIFQYIILKKVMTIDSLNLNFEQKITIIREIC